MANKRTDEQIHKEVLNGLQNNSNFDASGIAVRVKDGEVYLQGYVDSWESRRSALDIATNVSGVSKVHNGLEIHPIEKL